MKHKFLEGTLVLTKDRTQMNFNDNDVAGMHFDDIIKLIYYINSATDDYLNLILAHIITDSIDSSPRPMVLLKHNVSWTSRLHNYIDNANVNCAHKGVIERVCSSFKSAVEIPEVLNGDDNSAVVIYIAIDLVDGYRSAGAKLSHFNGIFSADELLSTMVTFKSRFLAEAVKRCK